MNFDLDTSNYSKEDYYEIFNLDKSLSITENLIKEKHETLLNNIKNENMDEEQKKEISTFLTECKKNLIEIIKKGNNYKLIDSDFIQDMNHSVTFNNSHHVIKKDGSDEYHTNKINPLPKNTTSTLLNINTKFRNNFYKTSATDFNLDLPEEFKNVVSITVVSVQVPNSNYTFCSSYGTNEFTIETFDISQNNSAFDANPNTHVIKIKEGIYTGPILQDYLNTSVFSEGALKRIACKYDGISRKFRFFRDLRSAADGGLPDPTFDPANAISTNKKHAFNIDFRLNEDKSRPIQMNMGWILGYRQQYYNWEQDYVDGTSVNFKQDQGYNPEAVYDNLGSRYFILCLDDFNKNYSNTLSSPFSESVFNNETAIAKVPNNPNSINFDDIFYQSRRNYFGPVNIKKLKIQLLDELGRVVDLNNNDFSFSIQIEQLYDAHLNKMYN
tara:strand:+ start:34 stop:1356 length:1323 start_codon:yes stop_codon:yes gene_type:complete